MRSESNAGYVQGRQRLPLPLLQQAQQSVAQEAQQLAGEAGRWQGLVVRLLDGTSFTTPPAGDLAGSYQPISNNHGAVHWLKVRAVVACDYVTQAVVGLAERSFYSSEQEMVPAVVGQDPLADSLYVADQNFGVYNVLQAITNLGHPVLLRLTPQRALALLQRQQSRRPLVDGQSQQVWWAPTRHDQPFASWPAEPIAGRLLYLHIDEAGYRPSDLYLFTTLLDEERYPPLLLGALYRNRWRVEGHLRHVKQSLQMEFFDVRSVDLFRKELAAGILTYNLICILLLQAALRRNLLPVQLSFKQGLRRIFSALTAGVPAWVRQEERVAEHLLEQLGKCRLPNQPHKVKHEPRQVRYRGTSYERLRGDRNVARQQLLSKLKKDDNS